jgi:biopolymer transport protein ExbB
MRIRTVASFVMLGTVLAAVCLAQGALLSAAEPPAAAATAPGAIPVSIDWLAEIMRGGTTALVQMLLVVAATAYAIERFINLRRAKIAPVGFTDEVKELWDQGDHAGILALCDEKPSTQARMVAYLVRHRDADYQTIMQGASDIGARDLKKHNQHAYPLAVVATLEPLLGLLGTMIGMIEAFAKVAAFGDTGDAGMLADAIGKALITTALGLIIAIPALALYHWFKQRTSLLGTILEEELEEIASSWFIVRSDDDAGDDDDAPAPVSPARTTAPARPVAPTRPAAAPARPQAAQRPSAPRP